MEKILLHEIYGNLVSTILALIAIIFSCFMVYFVFARKIDSNRRRRQFRVRSFYIACFIFIFLMARIWVEGFTHLLAVLGLVSAAIVVTNKETIMNFVGWLVINWRDLFSEDDLIQIQQYKGYVKSFGMLYFTLIETSEGMSNHITGKIIRVPNGLITNNALVNFSQTSHIINQTFTTVLANKCDHEYAVQFIAKLVNDILSKFYYGKKEYSIEYLKKHHKYLVSKINLDAKVTINLKPDKPYSIELITNFYCFYQDAEKIQQEIWMSLLKALAEEDKVKLWHSES